MFDTKFSSSTEKKGFSKIQSSIDRRIFKTVDISPTNQKSYPHVEKTDTNTLVIGSVLHLFTLGEYFFHEYGTNLSSRETARAQTKCQDNSTSGRGARASYRTMFPRFRPGDRF